MKRTFLHAACAFFCLCGISITSIAAQGSYGAVSYFNFTYAAVTDWTGFAGATVFKGAVGDDTLSFLSGNATGATRAKGGYSGAIRCQAIELPYYDGLGYLALYLQNGSSGTTRNLYLKVWDEASATWVLAETMPIGGNVDQKVTVTSVLSKKRVKVRIDSDGQYFWFYQLEAWSSKLATTNAMEAPKILSVDPAAGTVVAANGTIKIQFDELVKANTGSVAFSGATVVPTFGGNTLTLNYTGLSQALDTLQIYANAVQNIAGIALTKDTSLLYLNDVTDPVFVSVAPTSGSKIHINDLAGKIILTFDENIMLGTGMLSFGPATVSTTVSGKTLVIAYAGLSYSTPYTLVVPAGMIQDLSGNTYKNIISLAYTTNDRDTTAPKLMSQSVANGAVGVAIGGSLYFSFDEIVQQKGMVTLNGTPVTLSFNGGMVGMNYTNLAYHTSYTLNIPAAALTDTTGNAYPGTLLIFTTKAFASKDFDIVVAQDGSGDYTSIQAAINAVPDNAATRTWIYLKNGVYAEKVSIPASKQNLSLIGQDSAKTIITYNDYAGGAGGTDNSYTMDVKATGFYAERICIKNTWAVTGGSTNQAVALMTEGDMQVFKNCSTFSFQDTHYPKQPNTRNYYLNCLVQGATDFMFGSATAFFEGCRLSCVNGGQYITAPSGTTREFGLVYNHCEIDAQASVATQSYYLGRPWKDNAKTVWLNTKMGPHVKDIGWAVWATSGDDADNQLTGFFAEYNSMDLSGVSINPVRAAWGKKLTSDQAARYNIDQVFNYGIGSNTWNPLPYVTAPAALQNFMVDQGSLSWQAPAYAVGYVIFRNDTMIATTVNTQYTDVNTSNSKNSYAVKAVNEYGAQSDLPSVVSVVYDMQIGGQYLYPNPFHEVLHIKTSLSGALLEFYSVQGLLLKRTIAQNAVDTHELEKGTYLLKTIASDGHSFVVKIIKE